MSSFKQVGWVGLGGMGAPMAANLAKFLASSNQQPLKVFNRTSSKVDELASKLGGDAKISHAQSAVELGQSSDLIITSLANDDAATAVIRDLLEGIKSQGGKDVIIVETSTIAPETAQALSDEASKVPGVSYVQAPVFGPPPMAVEAKLVWVLSGPAEAKKRAEPYLVPSMGRAVLIDLGEDVKSASKYKLVGNSFVAGLIELLAEVMTFANLAGIGDDKFYEFIKQFVPAPSAIGYGGKMVNSTFDASPNGFSIDGGSKDCRHILNLAKSYGGSMPIVDLALNHLTATKELGGPDAGTQLDWSSLVAAHRKDSGLPPFKK